LNRLLFDRERMLAALDSLDRKLEAHGQPHQQLIVVGGSYLALAELRQSTRDIDVATRLTKATRQAVHDVAADKGLAPRWLNDDAAVFTPKGMTKEHCVRVFAGFALTVLAPSADWIFLMKLYAARAVDHKDLIRLWPLTGFATAEEAIARYWQAYPHAPADDDLEVYVADIVEHAKT
jgi:hypothetical protein